MEVRRKVAVRSFLGSHRRIGIDTSIFIYWIEANPAYADLVGPVFEWLDRPGAAGITSTVTMLELLVKPYREKRVDLVYEFISVLSNYPSLQFVDLTLPIAHAAAKLRAETRLKTPDAIQAACALATSATGFISNDPDFKKVAGLEVLVLKEL